MDEQVMALRYQAPHLARHCPKLYIYGRRPTASR
jgi:DNA-directed RNA polymerase subunit L